ncbi:MAG: ABC transporter ATP-binding protein [Candidatus Izemoplasmatales bacterium]|nr:ABC transporter ATP-binding protein [Candidatus Izemoplasmatales bacterium]
MVAEGLRIAGVRNEKEINHKVNEVLETVGLLPEHASRYPHEFSGGQRQRIGIARALIVAPEFIIADEPISALDVSIQAQVINLLNDLRDKLGITIMFIAHDLSVIKYFSDRIGVMYYGNLVEMASSDELFLNPLHPYTRSLLSAVPQPDPRYEKSRKRVPYDPRMHDYKNNPPKLHEIKEGHFVLANDKELAEYKSTLK